MNWDERKTMDGLPIVAADGGLRDRRYNVEEPKSPGTNGAAGDERKTMDGLPIVAAVF